MIFGDDGRKRFLEVKSEQWSLNLGGKLDYRAKRTPNIAFETHDIISAEQYETLWAGARTDARGLLVHPSTDLGYTRPTLPEWYGVPGGHIKTKADWLVHYFEPSKVCVALSLGKIRKDLEHGRCDRAAWFASCTARPGTRATCRRPDDPNIAYYTVGKRLDVQTLVGNGRAILLGDP